MLQDNLFLWVSEQISIAAAFYPAFIYMIVFLTNVLLSKSKLKKYRAQQAITGDKCIPQKKEFPK